MSSKKSKRNVKNKNKNKNKNINKIIVNVNSNNKKKVVKSKEKTMPQQSSGPIVISNPSPYVQQPMYYPQPSQLVDNSYGLGSHRLLEGLQTRLDDIKDELVHSIRNKQIENIKRQEFINNINKKLIDAQTNTDKVETRNVKQNTNQVLLSDAEVNTEHNNKKLLTPLSQGLETQKIMEARMPYKPRTSTPRPQERFTVPPKPQFSRGDPQWGILPADIVKGDFDNVLSDINNVTLSNQKSNTLNQNEIKLFGTSQRRPTTLFQDDMSSITFNSPNRMDNESILENINVLNTTMDTHASTVKSNDTYGTPRTSIKALVEDILDLDENIVLGKNSKYDVSLIDNKRYKKDKHFDIGDQIIVKKDGTRLYTRDLVNMKNRLIKEKLKRKPPLVEI